MRIMDSYGLAECRFQAELFEASCEKQACSSKIFVRRFMNSDLAERIDRDSFLYEVADIDSAFEDLDGQYGKSDYGVEKYTPDELHWIGYIYRYWAYITGKTSKSIYKLIKTDELRDLYYPYHSLDPEQAIDRIKESKNIVDVDDITRGVEILRRVRAKRGV
ncbi:MAG: antitoxin [Clostridiales bacterium]|nr:antitoxin [Clostridiales bacterium]